MLVATAALAPAGAAAAAAPGVVAHGSWRGVPWTLSAHRDAGGRLCTSFTSRLRAIPARLQGPALSSCTFRVRGSGSRHWLAFAASRSSTRGPLAMPDVVDGVAAAGVARVEIELRGSTSVHATLVSSLGQRIFVALLPKGRDVRSIAALDRNGTVLERRKVSLDAPHGYGAGASGHDLVVG